MPLGGHVERWDVPGLEVVDPPAGWTTDGREHGKRAYACRLRRDGWEVARRGDARRRLAGRVKVWLRQQTQHQPPPSPRGELWDEHWLETFAGRRLARPGGEWAEIDRRGNLLAARDGRLLRVDVDGDEVGETVVADLNPLTFRAVPPGTPPRRVG